MIAATKKKLLTEFIGGIVKEALLLAEGSEGREPTKEQIDATFDLLKTLTQNTKFSGKTYVAGGAVRDMVMGINPKDIDIVVEMEEGGIRFATYIAKRLGIFKEGSNPVTFPKFGTAKVSFDGVEHNGIKLDGIDVEVVNTREEEYEEGSRKPTTKFGTIKQDVFRRDLTINSLLMDLVSGEIVDLTGHGREDIAKGVIRTPSEPDRIFTDDPLRLLRAARFAGRYNYTMPDFMRDSIKKNAAQLETISKERIREELEKILSGSNPETGMAYLFDLGLVPFIIPQISNKKPESMEAAQRGVGFLGKLILMLKDLSPNTVAGIARDLKFSNEQVTALSTVVEEMQRISTNHTNASILRAGTNLYTRGYKEYIDMLKPLDKQVSQLEPYFSKGPVVYFTGDELMRALNLKPGPIVGKLINYQKNLWYENPEITGDEAMEKLVQELGK